MPLQNTSTLETLSYLPDSWIFNIHISHDEILLLIRNIAQNKASGADGIYPRMLKWCNDSIITPLKLLFQTIIFQEYTQIFES